MRKLRVRVNTLLNDTQLAKGNARFSKAGLFPLQSCKRTIQINSELFVFVRSGCQVAMGQQGVGGRGWRDGQSLIKADDLLTVGIGLSLQAPFGIIPIAPFNSDYKQSIPYAQSYKKKKNLNPDNGNRSRKDISTLSSFFFFLNLLKYSWFLFHILFHYGLSQDIECSSPCYTVGPGCLTLCSF